jgi:threonine aldolase
MVNLLLGASAPRSLEGTNKGAAAAAPAFRNTRLLIEDPLILNALFKNPSIQVKGLNSPDAPEASESCSFRRPIGLFLTRYRKAVQELPIDCRRTDNQMKYADFRSDTVTWPTPEMREAMAHAEVGDDVFQEDPTINRLETLAAECMKKESALFVASGTMGNLVSILTHARRGDEAIVGEACHSYCWEAGGMAALGGITPRPLPMDDHGQMDPAQVEAAIRGDDPHWPHSRLILLENTAGGRFGAAIPPDYFRTIRAIADRYNLKIHLDGARIFNAATALAIPVHQLTEQVDSVSFCLSKGLCAPAGSVICGSHEFIHEARRIRKSIGGGMRQAGILAAAGIIALETMTKRLAEDHANAQALVRGLARIPGVVIDPEKVHTNLVFFELAPETSITAYAIADALEKQFQIKIMPTHAKGFRAVTHYWIRPEHVEQLLHALQTLVR